MTDYKHDTVSVTIDDKKVDIPSKPHPSLDPTAFLISTRDNKKVPIADIQQLYNLHGSYAKVAKITGISDKTIKRYVIESAPAISELQHIDNSRDPLSDEFVPKVNKSRAMITKASRIVNTWMEGSSPELSDVMSSLLTSINDADTIRRAPLRDRAIAFGIITERLQKSQELEIRQQEADIKKIEVGRKNEEIELEKRRVAALEKGITINVGRRFEDVSNIVNVEEINPNE